MSRFRISKNISLLNSRTLLNLQIKKYSSINQDFNDLKFKEIKYSPAVYRDLSKMKLSAFVLLTTMAGYALAPGVSTASTLLYTCLGTGLCISSANAINQWTEVIEINVGSIRRTNEQN